MRAIIRISAASMILLLGIAAVSALEQRFDRPRYKDGRQLPRLDVCFTFGRDCGQKAADSYCSIHGFVTARRFETEHARPTQTLEDAKVCDADFCAAFKNIVCFTRELRPGPGHGWPQRLD